MPPPLLFLSRYAIYIWYDGKTIYILLRDVLKVFCKHIERYSHIYNPLGPGGPCPPLTVLGRMGSRRKWRPKMGMRMKVALTDFIMMFRLFRLKLFSNRSLVLNKNNLNFFTEQLEIFLAVLNKEYKFFDRAQLCIKYL